MLASWPFTPVGATPSTPAGATHPSVINLDTTRSERLPFSRLPCPGAPGPDDPIVSNVGGSGLAVQVCPSGGKTACARGLFMCTSGLAAGQCDLEPWAAHSLADCSSYCRMKIDSWTPVRPANTSRASLSTLVVAVAGDGSQEFVAKNVRAQPSLDFGVVLYSGSYDDWRAVRGVAKATGNRFWLKKGEVPAGVNPSNHGFIPKLWFQSQASEWVRSGGYEYVWMVDEDIAFHANFDYPEFWSRHQHEYPDGPPLLSQPTIRQNTQSDRFIFNANTYPCETRVAVTTQVEQQTPLFDAKFWLWLEPRLTTLKNKQVELGSDWITDQSWCNAAARYDPTRTACGVITTPIDHADKRTIGWDKGRDTIKTFYRQGRKAAEWVCSMVMRRDRADAVDLATHAAQALLPPDASGDGAAEGEEWLTWFRDYKFPPKATLLVPPLPSGTEEGGLPYPFFNEKEGSLGPFCDGKKMPACSHAMPACHKVASLVTNMYATRAEQLAAWAEISEGPPGHNASHTERRPAVGAF